MFMYDNLPEELPVFCHKAAKWCSWNQAGYGNNPCSSQQIILPCIPDIQHKQDVLQINDCDDNNGYGTWEKMKQISDPCVTSFSQCLTGIVLFILQLWNETHAASFQSFHYVAQYLSISKFSLRINFPFLILVLITFPVNSLSKR